MFVIVAATSPRVGAADERLLLEVVVNGYSTNKIGEFVLRDGNLLSRSSELLDLGFRVPDSVVTTDDGLVALSALPGLTWRIDQATQTLSVTAPANNLLPTLLRLGAAAVAAVPIETGTGATANYDLTGTSVGSQNVASGVLDLRGFSPWGVISSGALGYAGSSPAGPGKNSAIRLDSTYVYSDPDTLRRYRLGDFIIGGLAWTRPIRLGGGQLNSDFSMRPDLVTFPLPLVGGSVAVPSTVDVLLNGTRLLSREVQPGPFQIPQMPVVTGAGTVSMSLTDALGKQVTTTLPFYASSSLLAPGLQTYSVEVGKVRRNWGIVSDNYGNLAGSASYRRGLSSKVTVEAHAEGTGGEFMAGAGGVVNVANLGVLNFAAAASGRASKQLSAGAQRSGQVFSFGLSATFADHMFRDIAAMNGDPVPRRQINANVGLSVGRFGSFGIAYTSIDRDASPAPIIFFNRPGAFLPQNAGLVGESATTAGGFVSFLPARHSHVVSASYSVQIGNISLYTTGFRDFASGGSSGVLFGLTIPFGGRSSAGATAGSGSGVSYEQVEASQSTVSIGDWGYQAYGATGNPGHEFAQFQYKSPWALVSAGADRLGPQTALRAEAQGAVSYADGGFFASNAINDSFAIVDTAGAEGIHVLSENRDMGRTDTAGRLLVPDLRSFELNHISIDPSDVPGDATIPYTTRDVRPQDRSGVVVRFPVRVSRGALLRLVDEAGAVISVGSTATLTASGRTMPVGYGGEAYIEDLAPRDNQLLVERPNGRRCIVIFDYHAVPGEIPTMGPFPCRENGQ